MDAFADSQTPMPGPQGGRRQVRFALGRSPSVASPGSPQDHAARMGLDRSLRLAVQWGRCATAGIRTKPLNSSDGRCGHLCPAVPMLRARFKSVLHSPSPKSLPPHPSAYPSPKRLPLTQAPAPDPSVRSITRASVHSPAHTI